MPITGPATAVAVRVEPAALVLVLREGEARIPWERCSVKLAQASDAERKEAELSPGGYGIRWSLLDEDLSVTGLLREKELPASRPLGGVK